MSVMSISLDEAIVLSSFSVAPAEFVSNELKKKILERAVMLLNANIDALNQRYRENNKHVTYQEASAQYFESMSFFIAKARKIDPLQKMQSLDFFTYQVCGLEDFYTSEVYRTIQHILSSVKYNSELFKGLAWGIPV